MESRRKDRKLTAEDLAKHAAGFSKHNCFDNASAFSGRTTATQKSSSSGISAVSANMDRQIFQGIKNGIEYDDVHRVLYLAASLGEKEVVKLIISFCPNAVNRPNELRNNSTPLMAACLNTQNHLEVVKMLLDHGADTCLKSNRVAYKNTAFHWAAVRGAELVLKCLLEKNPHGRNFRDVNNQTPLEVLDSTKDIEKCFDKDLESIPNAVVFDCVERMERKDRIRQLLLDCIPQRDTLCADFTLGLSSTDHRLADAPVADAKPENVAESIDEKGASDAGVDVERNHGHEPEKEVVDKDAVLQDQVDCGLVRRSPAFVRSVFDQFAEGRSFLTKQELLLALCKLGYEKEGMDARGLIVAEDSCENFDFEAFFQHSKRLFKSLEWCELMELHEMLLDSLPKAGSEHPLLVISKLSSDEVSSVCRAFGHGLKKVLKGFSFHLDKTFVEAKCREMEKDSKFVMVSTESELDEDKEQQEALDKLYRSQYYVAQKPASAIYTSMESEHCHTPDSNEPITMSKIVTTAKREWEIVNSCSSLCNKDGRMVPDIDSALSKCNGVVTREELLTVVLYTGPMYIKYNCILRQSPAKDYESLKDMDSVYTTTICVLISALVTLSRTQPNRTARRILYRGLCGENPFNIWLPSHSGRGLTSSTEDQFVARRFSGITKGRLWPTIYEITSGDLQNGANIDDFSQYPGQKEVLFPPFCQLIPQDMRLVFLDETIVSKVKLSIHVCHEFQSLDDLRKKKNVIHKQVLEMALEELKLELCCEMEKCKSNSKLQLEYSMLIDKILEQCKDHMKTQYHLNSQEFFDDNSLRWLNNQVMDLKEMGRSKFRICMEKDGDAGNMDLSLLEWKREWTRLQQKALSSAKGEEQASMALALCQSLGLVRKDVKEVNELGETPLLAAAASGERPSHILLLVMAKADIAATDKSLQRGVLHLAAANWHSDAIPTLVQLGASLIARDSAGMTPLDIAQECGNLQVTTALKSAEALQVPRKEEDSSALHAEAATPDQTGFCVAEDSGQARMPTQ